MGQSQQWLANMIAKARVGQYGTIVVVLRGDALYAYASREEHRPVLQLPPYLQQGHLPR